MKTQLLVKLVISAALTLLIGTAAYAAPPFEVMDVDKDGKPDLLTGGNFYRVKPEVGRYDGSYGSVFRGDGKGNFTAIPASRSGVQIDGEVRDIVTLTTPQGTVVVFSRNNQAVKVYRLE